MTWLPPGGQNSQTNMFVFNSKPFIVIRLLLGVRILKNQTCLKLNNILGNIKPKQTKHHICCLRTNTDFSFVIFRTLSYPPAFFSSHRLWLSSDLPKTVCLIKPSYMEGCMSQNHPNLCAQRSQGWTTKPAHDCTMLRIGGLSGVIIIQREQEINNKQVGSKQR